MRASWYAELVLRAELLAFMAALVAELAAFIALAKSENDAE